MYRLRSIQEKTHTLIEKKHTVYTYVHSKSQYQVHIQDCADILDYHHDIASIAGIHHQTNLLRHSETPTDLS